MEESKDERIKRLLRQQDEALQAVSTNVSGNKSQIPQVKREYSLPDAILGGAINTPSSVWNEVAKPLGNFVTNPKETFGNIYNSLTLSPDNPIANAVIGDIQNRYGSWENFKRGIAEHPALFLQDASMLFGGLGAGAKASGLGRLAEGLNTASKITDPITAPLRFAGKINEGVEKVANRIESSA